MKQLPVADVERDLSEVLEAAESGETEELLRRISIDPDVCFGKPCIRGTRIWVSLILDLLASGLTETEVIDEYPHLVPDDIRAAIACGAEMSRKRYVEIQVGKVS
jgi:uncharacterized protein (DUF433 family)